MDTAEQTTVRPAARRGAASELASLQSAAAVRERCRMVHRWVAAGNSPHFTLDETKLADVADTVTTVTRAAYPDLVIPPHSRWRHFSAGGIDRWDRIANRLAGVADIERARVAVDLATVSVLLDAGAGDRWRYRETGTKKVFARSEGLAVASVDMFAAGDFSSDPERPLRVDAAALKNVDSGRIARGFQVSTDNPLIGADGRAALLRRLGHALEVRPDLFGRAGRPGHLVDHFAASSRDRRVPAPEVLRTLLASLSAIWPSGLVVDGVHMGDAGLHPAIQTGDATDRIVPFHKLSQWLTYSLIEPLAMADLTMADLDRAHGARRVSQRRPADRSRRHPAAPADRRRRKSISSELVVEWRALTVALMDELLGLVRQRLGLGDAFTLPHLLQGGTWSAGRRIALELRPPHGPPPIPLAADGTVF